MIISLIFKKEIGSLDAFVKFWLSSIFSIQYHKNLEFLTLLCQFILSRNQQFKEVIKLASLGLETKISPYLQLVPAFITYENGCCCIKICWLLGCYECAWQKIFRKHGLCRPVIHQKVVRDN
jgi:hypothetical protein